MRVRFLTVAEIELDEAIRWYQSQASGLGDAFLVEILSAAERIASYPDAWQSLDGSVRRCRLSRFPYGLIYAIEGTDILGARSRALAPRAGLLARSPDAVNA